MPRFKLTIEYDGTPFQGWQMQPGYVTVQGALADALYAITGETVSVQGAGRTDQGVHATGQVAHIDLARDWVPGRLRDAMNAHVRPLPVAVLAVEAVTEAFNARFSARRRDYRYLILNRRAPPALEAMRVWHVMAPLDAEAMNVAARTLLGHHDFTTFRNADCQGKSPFKTLDHLSVSRSGEHVIVETHARSYLHNQVRSMVGCLKRVGEGAWPADRPRAVLEAKDRALCAALAPPHGLYLTGVGYPDPTSQPEDQRDSALDEEAEDQV
jgi:tRNA pseudouridine38-40 synthase